MIDMPVMSVLAVVKARRTEARIAHIADLPCTVATECVPARSRVVEAVWVCAALWALQAGSLNSHTPKIMSLEVKPSTSYVRNPQPG